MKATRHTRISGTKNWIALDSGGTMTDAVVVDTSGSFLVGKYLTIKQNESVSVLGAITDASKTACLELKKTMSQADIIVYAGTIMLNTLLSRTARRSA